MATHTQLTTAFTSLLTVSIHTLLYQRTLYPRASFLTTRFHNYPVHQSRHPLVCTWITDAVSAVAAQLQKGTLQHVVLVIFDPQHRPVERFVFDVSRFPVVANKSERDLIIERRDPMGGDGAQGEGAEQRKEDAAFDFAKLQESVSADLSESFRAVLARLSTISTKLTPLPKDCSFTIVVEVKDDAPAPTEHPQPWIPAEPGQQVSGRESDLGGQKKGADRGGARTVPVRSVEAGEMVFELWVEEGKAKFEGGKSQQKATSSSG